MILEAVRRAKSNKGVSIKYPLEQVSVAQAHDAADSAIWEDVKAAGNVTALNWETSAGEMELKSEDERFDITVTFAAEAEDKGAA